MLICAQKQFFTVILLHGFLLCYTVKEAQLILRKTMVWEPALNQTHTHALYLPRN